MAPTSPFLESGQDDVGGKADSAKTTPFFIGYRVSAALLPYVKVIASKVLDRGGR